MKLSPKAAAIGRQIDDNTKLGDLRKIAAQIKTDHDLALELWSTGMFMHRLLSILIMDKKMLSQSAIDSLDKDMQLHPYDDRNQLMDWLMANQLSKDRKLIALMESWKDSPSSLQRRTYWYYQARLRWMGQKPHDNAAVLLESIERDIAQEQPEVQWAMNFAAGWIGVFDETYRNRCIELGEKTGLYRDEIVHKGCTPQFLPSFISTEVSKRNKAI